MITQTKTQRGSITTINMGHVGTRTECTIGLSVILSEIIVSLVLMLR